MKVDFWSSVKHRQELIFINKIIIHLALSFLEVKDKWKHNHLYSYYQMKWSIFLLERHFLLPILHLQVYNLNSITRSNLEEFAL